MGRSRRINYALQLYPPWTSARCCNRLNRSENNKLPKSSTIPFQTSSFFHSHHDNRWSPRCQVGQSFIYLLSPSSKSSNTAVQVCEWRDGPHARRSCRRVHCPGHRRLAMPPSGTKSVDHVFQTKMVDMLKQTGPPEMVVGWYHSHRSWLSSVDITMQLVCK